MNSPNQPQSEESTGAISEARVMQSLLSQEQFLQLLDASIIKHKSASAMSAVHSVGGRVNQSEFVLTKLANFKNGFARDLHGSVIPLEQGSQIVYRFELNILVRMMFTLWFILVIGLFLAGIAKIFMGSLRLELLVGPVVLLAGGLFVINFAIGKGRQEEKELEQFLHRIASAQPGQ